MKAITLHEPWATLVAQGHKTRETRGKAAPLSLIGRRIAIHAGKHVDPGAQAAFGRIEVHPGHVVATAMLFGCFQVTSLKPVKGGDALAICSVRPQYCAGEFPADMLGVVVDRYGDFSVGRWIWLLEEIEPLEPPVPAVGHQWFWDWPLQRLRQTFLCRCGHTFSAHGLAGDNPCGAPQCACPAYDLAAAVVVPG